MPNNRGGQPIRKQDDEAVTQEDSHQKFDFNSPIRLWNSNPVCRISEKDHYPNIPVGPLPDLSCSLINLLLCFCLDHRQLVDAGCDFTLGTSARRIHCFRKQSWVHLLVLIVYRLVELPERTLNGSNVVLLENIP